MLSGKEGALMILPVKGVRKKPVAQVLIKKELRDKIL